MKPNSLFISTNNEDRHIQEEHDIIVISHPALEAPPTLPDLPDQEGHQTADVHYNKIGQKRKISDQLEESVLRPQKRRQRTRLKNSKTTQPNLATVKAVHMTWESPSLKTFSIDDFISNKDEELQLNTLLDEALAYMIYKNMITDFLPNKTGKTFQGFLESMKSSENLQVEQSNVVYINILDEYADNQDTILHALSVLQDRLQVGKKQFPSCWRWEDIQPLTHIKIRVWLRSKLVDTSAW